METALLKPKLFMMDPVGDVPTVRVCIERGQKDLLKKILSRGMILVEG